MLRSDEERPKLTEIRLSQLTDNLSLGFIIFVEVIWAADLKLMHLRLIKGLWRHVLLLVFLYRKLASIAALIIQMLFKLAFTWCTTIKHYRDRWDVFFWDLTTGNHSILLFLQVWVSFGAVLDAVASMMVIFFHLLTSWCRLYDKRVGVVGPLVQLVEIIYLQRKLIGISAYIGAVTSLLYALSNESWRRAFIDLHRTFLNATLRSKAWE